MGSIAFRLQCVGEDQVEHLLKPFSTHIDESAESVCRVALFNEMESSFPVDAELLKAGGMEVRYETRSKGTVITIELVRERTLNALTSDTFRALHAVLDNLPAQGDVQLVIVARGRAFSAGGDVRALRNRVFEDADDATRRQLAYVTLKTEYDLLSRWAKLAGSRVVTMAVADGYAFGAGNGLLQACQLRLVTERAVIAMPECKIGLVPDCGASHFLTRLPGSLGMFAALTGWRVRAGDAVKLGLADGMVQQDWRGESLTGSGALNAINLTPISADNSSDISNASSAMRRDIDTIFGQTSLSDILIALDVAVDTDAGAKWIVVARREIRGASPRALLETVRVMKEGYARTDGLDAALQRELEVDTELSMFPDFAEGVRAALIDKDNSPQWQPCPAGIDMTATTVPESTRHGL